VALVAVLFHPPLVSSVNPLRNGTNVAAHRRGWLLVFISIISFTDFFIFFWLLGIRLVFLLPRLDLVVVVVVVVVVAAAAAGIQMKRRGKRTSCNQENCEKNR